VAGGIKFGYDYNVIGFGWTNASFVELLAKMPATKKADVLNLSGMSVP